MSFCRLIKFLLLIFLRFWKVFFKCFKNLFKHLEITKFLFCWNCYTTNELFHKHVEFVFITKKFLTRRNFLFTNKKKGLKMVMENFGCYLISFCLSSIFSMLCLPLEDLFPFFPPWEGYVIKNGKLSADERVCCSLSKKVVLVDKKRNGCSWFSERILPKVLKLF